jgi:hypothetical protein
LKNFGLGEGNLFVAKPHEAKGKESHMKSLRRPLKETLRPNHKGNFFGLEKNVNMNTFWNVTPYA